MLCCNQSCCLKVSQTSNTQDCCINQRSRAGLRVVWSICQGLVMSGASCNLFCGISFMSFSVSQRQILWNLWHVKNLIWAAAWENLSSEMCEQVRLKLKSFTLDLTFWQLFKLSSQRTSKALIRLCIFVGHIMEYIHVIQLLSSWRCSFHYQKQPRHSWLHV